MRTMPALSKFTFTVPRNRAKEVFEQLEQRYLAQTSEPETLVFEGIITIPDVGAIGSVGIDYPDPEGHFDLDTISRVAEPCTISLSFVQGKYNL